MLIASPAIAVRTGEHETYTDICKGIKRRRTAHEYEAALVLVARKDPVEHDRQIGRDIQQRADAEHREVREPSPRGPVCVCTSTRPRLVEPHSDAHPMFLFDRRAFSACPCFCERERKRWAHARIKVELVHDLREAHERDWRQIELADVATVQRRRREGASDNAHSLSCEKWPAFRFSPPEGYFLSSPIAVNPYSSATAQEQARCTHDTR